MSAENTVDPARTQFLRLLAKYQQSVFGYILSLVPNWADAEEIAQETCVRLWEQRDKWQPETDFRAWACTVAYYQVLTYRKRKHREKLVFSEESFDALAEQVTADAGAVDFESRLRALADCMKRVGRSGRELLTLVYHARLPMPQAAERWGRSSAATYKALSRIRASLHDCIERSMRVQERG